MTDPVSSTSLSTIQFGGVASGLDTKSIIDALLSAETQRVTSLQNQSTQLAARNTAYGDLRTSLNNLLVKAQAFTLLRAATNRSATSSSTDTLTASALSGAPTGQYRVVVDHLATQTVATSPTAIGSPVADPSAMLSTLKMAGTVKGGTLTVVVDGTLATVQVGDPTTTSLQDVMDALAAKIQTLAGDGSVSVSVAANRMQISMTGNTASHKILFGAPTDTSNVLALSGLVGSSATLAAGGGTMTGGSLLGVTQASAVLDGAGLTGLVATAAGQLKVNGVSISYDTSKDSLSAVLSRINNSAAGVVASIDRTNDRVMLTSKVAGAQPIVLEDASGTLLASLGLQPGTTNAQQIGENALIHVNGQAVTSATNQVANAIEGVTLNLVAESPTAVNVTVGVDVSKIESGLNDLVGAYNDLADKLDTMTANDPKGTKGVLASDISVEMLLTSVRQALFSPIASPIGGIASMADIGVSTGKVGSTVGSTGRLTLDSDKLHAALLNSPGGVAQLLGPTGGLTSTVTRLKSWLDAGGILSTRTRSVADQIHDLADEQRDAQDRLDQRRTALEAKFASMESMLSQMQQTLSGLSNQTAQMNK